MLHMALAAFLFSSSTPLVLQATPKVSLDFDLETVGEVCQELEKQSKIHIVLAPDLVEQTISIRIENRPLDFVIKSLSTVLGCKSKFVLSEWRFGLDQDGRPDLDALRKKARINEKKSIQEFSREFAAAGTIEPRALLKSAENLTNRIRDLEQNKPNEWRSTRRSLLNSNYLTLEMARSPELWVVANQPNLTSALLNGFLVVRLNSADRKKLPFTFQNPEATELDGVCFVSGGQLQVKLFERNSAGNLVPVTCKLDIFGEDSNSTLNLKLPIDPEIQAVPKLPISKVNMSPVDQIFRPSTGELISAISKAAKCEYITTTDRQESIAGNGSRLDEWAASFTERNGGLIGWSDGVLLCSNLKVASNLLQKISQKSWRQFEAPSDIGADPDLIAYSNFLAKSGYFNNFEFPLLVAPLMRVNGDPLLATHVMKLVQVLTPDLRAKLFGHQAIDAEVIGSELFTSAFFEAIFRDNRNGSGRAFLRFVDSGYSLKGLQVFYDSFPSESVVVRNEKGQFEVESVEAAEKSDHKLAAKVVEHRFRFGYSDSECAEISFLLRAPLQPK